MPIVERAGHAIHYEVSGRGDAILFAHSFLCDGSMFAYQVAALQQRWRVINVDLRGHGRSAEALTPVNFYDFAADVIAVLDAEQVAQAVWVGLSIGGFTALRAALKRPERVRAGAARLRRRRLVVLPPLARPADARRREGSRSLRSCRR